MDDNALIVVKDCGRNGRWQLQLQLEYRIVSKRDTCELKLNERL